MVRPRIAIDMDEVIADVLPKFLDIYYQLFNVRLQTQDYWGKKVYQINGADQIRSYLHDKGFFLDLPVMPGSQETVQWLMQYYDVYITTAAMEFRSSFEDKYDWIERHFPFIHWKNIVFCGDKSIIQADYMIDDHAFNLRTFNGKGLLYTASHNIHETGFTRVNNWQEIRAFFEGEKERVG